ncbi:hypothetical protein [Variovorax saccharolyticus]|uniref:hypothetical protein n=1 Tax=Variovorax saccharolyticus TaxID=3053516 RepID=UPI002574D59F|nr:hypothetical protein [Variovorax sp. J31P216]MDM0030479.1 hypothetical protein [Variovorax sp. J31P216]
MQLKSDLDGQNLLNQVIHEYYERQNRIVRNFSSGEEQDGAYYTYYLIDRKHVIRYSIGPDREFMLGAVELAIGPNYFNPAAFWSYENYQRFSMDATTEAVELNLFLLDEFLGCKGGC